VLTKPLKVVSKKRVMFSVDLSYNDDLKMDAWFDKVELTERTKTNLEVEDARALSKLGAQL
jgi:hypothetical protein